MRRFRRVAYILLGIVVAIGIAGVVAKLYLASARGSADVASRLESIYGARISVGEVDVGVGSSSLRDVRLYEAGPDAPVEPWAVIDDVRADVSAWALLSGNAVPGIVTLSDAVVTLRFDERGRLLTRFPKREGKDGAVGVKTIRILNGKVILRQTGRPDLIVAVEKADFLGEGDRFTLTGTAEEGRWGSANLSGYLLTGTGEFTLGVKVADVRFTQSMLDDLPFVSPATWQHVQAQGQGTGELTLHYVPETERVHYCVVLNAERTKLFISAIDLHAAEAQGKVVIDDGLVKLTDVRGQSASGTIATSGELDFRKPVDRLQFKVQVERVKLSELPKKWFQNPLVQRLFDGRLSGEADLVVTIDADGARTSGEGKGIIREARLGGQAAPPVRLKLSAEGKGFKISVPPPDPDQPSRGQATPASSWFDAVVPLAWTAVTGIAKRVLDTGAKAAASMERLASAFPSKQARPATLEIDLALRDADLEALLRELQFELPLITRGRLSFDVHIVIPLDTAHDLKSYRVQGTASLAWLRLADLELEQVQTRLDYRHGILNLHELSGRLPGPMPASGGPPHSGAIAGDARLQLVPLADLSTRLQLDGIPAAQATRLLPVKEPVSGSFSGRLRFQAPLRLFSDPTGWQASGTLSSDRLGAFGWEATALQIDAQVARGVLTIPRATGAVEGARVVGSGWIELSAPYRCEAHATLRTDEAVTVARITQRLSAPSLRAGRFDLDATLDGTLRPFDTIASGTARASAIAFGDWAIDEASCQWSQLGEQLRLTELCISAYGGQATGEALLPLRAAMPGRVLALFADVDLSRLGGQFGSSIAVQGRANGSFFATLGEANAEGHRDIRYQIDVQAPRLRLESIPAERLRGSVLVQDGDVEARFAANLLGGGIVVEGRRDATTQRTEGRVRLEAIQLGRIWTALGIKDVLGPFRGSADLDAAFAKEAGERSATGKGRFVLNRLRWADIELGEGVTGAVVLENGVLRVKDISGSLGRGVVRGRVTYRLNKPSRGSFAIALDSVEASRLLSPWPEAATRVDGLLDVRFDGAFASEWRGNGSVALARGNLFGVEVVNARMPFDFSFIPQERRGKVEIRESSAQVAQGQASAKAAIGWGSGSRIDGSVRFFGVDLRGLLRSASDMGQMGAGQVSGRFDVSGTDVRSLADLDATLDATLQQTQALQLPILRQLSPYIAPGQSASATFQGGEMKARLSRGMIRIQHFQLVGSIVQVIIEGTISLGGTLNLEATANTGGLTALIPGLRALSAELAEGPLPLSLIAQATRLLSVRLTHLRITGTVRNPVVQRDPIVMLTEEAVRFFLGGINR
ncbi:MAG: AsmA-like C-terminal region-containing protein [Gemmataceae bacterium]|nr:AsmA-like C-terminal region-containing protein [Gemmataceae bacterium]